MFEYVIQYILNGFIVNDDTVYSSDDAAMCVGVAMDVGMCDTIIITHMWENNTTMIVTMSNVCGVWGVHTHDYLCDTHTMEVV